MIINKITKSIKYVEISEKYKSVLPDDLMSILEDFGAGSINSELFFINPDDYVIEFFKFPTPEGRSIESQEGIVIARTASVLMIVVNYLNRRLYIQRGYGGDLEYLGMEFKSVISELFPCYISSKQVDNELYFLSINDTFLNFDKNIGKQNVYILIDEINSLKPSKSFSYCLETYFWFEDEELLLMIAETPISNSDFVYRLSAWLNKNRVSDKDPFWIKVNAIMYGH
jgi:hypothetical protein